MRFDAVIFLVKEVYSQDDIGNSKTSQEKRKAFANRFAISRSEFTAAGEQGLRPDFAFQINTVDYAGEEKAIYLGNTYTIYRVQESGDRTTLYLTSKVSDHE
jgi:hypothetical protein